MEIVRQDGIMDCGVSCLLSIVRYYGGNVPIEYLREKTSTTKDGVTAFKLVETANSLGFNSYGLNGELKDLKDDFLPIIAHVIINKNIKHFIVIYQIDRIKRQLIVMDPDQGKVKLSFSEFNLMTSYNFIYLKPIDTLPNIIIKRNVTKWIKNFSKKHFIFLTYITIFSFISFIINIICSFHFTLLLNNGISMYMKNNVLSITLIFINIYSMKICLNFFKDKTSIKFSVLLDEFITKKYYHKLILLPYIYYKNRTTGEIISRMEDLNVIKEFLTNMLVVLFTDVLSILVFSIVLFNSNKKLFFLLLSFSIVLFLIEYVYIKIQNNRIVFLRASSDKINTMFIESLEKSLTIKNTHMESRIINKFYKKYEKFLEKSYSVSSLFLVHNVIKSGFQDLFYIMFFLLLSNRVIDNEMSVGMIIILDNIIKYYLNSYNRILTLYSDYHKFKISKRRIEDLFMIREENFGGYDYYKKIDLCGTIKYHNLTYAYNSNLLFDKLCFEIKPKEKVFFSGCSGSGKSTLMKMLMRYIEVPFGEITINGIDINHHHLEVLRNKISYVSQNESLFKDTIKNNITLGRDISYEKLDLVCRITKVSEIVESKDTKFNTLVDREGQGLSGGERQRIVLARCLLNDSNIYIFDESLSQIDEVNERKILKKIFNYLADKTVIVISHRMTNRDLYTKAIKLDNRRIIEEI